MKTILRNANADGQYVWKRLIKIHIQTFLLKNKDSIHWKG